MRSLFLFVLNSALLGFGLAMDAFSVSVANGLNAPDMPRGWRVLIPSTFAFFQFIMPMIGWFCVRTVAETFEAFQRAVPWIALGLLGFIGGKMVWEGLTGGEAEGETAALGPGTLFMQGVATSIDALSVGFTISEYREGAALAASAVIALVTYIVCACGLSIGRRFGTKLSNRASLLGGAILIAIGIEIFIKGL